MEHLKLQLVKEDGNYYVLNLTEEGYFQAGPGEDWDEVFDDTIEDGLDGNDAQIFVLYDDTFRDNSTILKTSESGKKWLYPGETPAGEGWLAVDEYGQIIWPEN